MANLSHTNRIKDLFSEALELDDAERTSLLLSAAENDPLLERELRALISAHERARCFMCERDVPETPRLPAGEDIGDFIDRYQLLEVIGEGGFGRVYRAQQRVPVVRTVALKVIKAGMDSRQVHARFETERQALAMMDHPGIAMVLDAGATASGRPYFVMELVDGTPITKYCDAHHLTIEHRLRLLRQVCAAVQHAHTKGVIHRDLKPSNVLITMLDGQPQPKIIDFGIAKATSVRLADKPNETELLQLIGTPEYMSPEQADSRSSDIDTRSDVYSLGVMLYELLTGVTPFESSRLRSSPFVEVQRIIREEQPLRPSARLTTVESLSRISAQRASEPRRLASLIRGDLDWISLKALEKNRDRRYSSAAELAEDLRRHSTHEPVLARPPSVAYLARRLVRRHRVAVIATSLIVIGILTGAILATIGMLQARHSAGQAREAAEQASAVNEFMRDVLTRANPERDGADVRLVEVLDKASAAASQRFSNHPAQEAAVRDLLGAVYSDLSFWTKAKTEYQRAMDLWIDEVGIDDPRAINSERMYVGTAINNNQVAEVAARLPELWHRAQRVLGSEHLATLDVERSIGIAHMMAGRLDEAERMFLKVRERAPREGDGDELQIRTLRSLIRIARMRSVQADQQTRARMVSQIEPLAREQVERAVRAYGMNSLIATDARIKWAELLADQRHYDSAATICREVLESASVRLGECHVLRLEASNVLAEALHRQGDSAAAADLTLSNIACKRQSEDPLALLVAVSDALPILERGERWTDGEALSRELVARLDAVGGGHGDMRLAAELWMARFISLQNREAEAETIFQSLMVRAQQFGLSGRALARLHLFHGGNLFRMQQFEASEAEIKTAADGLVDFRLGTLNANPDDVLLEYIRLYHAWGKPDRAREYEVLRQQTLANLPIDPS